MTQTNPILLLDGSLGQELVKRHGKPPTPLWSTAVMLDNVELVEAVHRDYLAAGASVVTTNTYAIHRDRLEPQGMDSHFETLFHMATAAAARARDAHGSGLIAGSLGPLGASYRADLAPPPEEAAEIYAEEVALLAPEVDFFILETVAGIDPAKGAIMAAHQAKKPIMLALTVKDDDGNYLRSGETVAEAMTALADEPIDAILLNCSVPEAIDTAFPQLTHARTGAYANGFTHITDAFAVKQQVVTDLSARTDLTPEAHMRFVRGWRDQGATILGGCCEIGPEHIRHMHDALLADGATLTSEFPK